MVYAWLSLAACSDTSDPAPTANDGGSGCPPAPAGCTREGDTSCSDDRRTVEICERRDGCLRRVTHEPCHAQAICAGAPASCQQVAAGRSNACHLAGGAVRCWGDFKWLTPLAMPPSRVTLLAQGRPGQISVGNTHACALVAGGEVDCWGYGNSGSLAHSSTEHPFTAKTLAREMTAVFAGEDASCARDLDRNVRCWGRNAFGQLGGLDESLTMQGPTLTPAYGTEVRDLALPRDVTWANGCAASPTGTRCLGRGVALGKPEVGPAEGLIAPMRIGVGVGFTCALEDSRRLMCWGTNSWGQLGVPGAPSTDGGPLPVLPIATAFAVGHNHACAVTPERRLLCWGNNRGGAIGNGQSGDMAAPVTTPHQIAELADVLQVAAGDDFTCALIADGQVRCWGKNDVGQLGLLPLGPMRASPGDPVPAM